MHRRTITVVLMFTKLPENRPSISTSSESNAKRQSCDDRNGSTGRKSVAHQRIIQKSVT